MKIVTYNVNGLRQRVAQHGSLLRLLNSFDADIICFQETKLSRQDLSVNLVMAEGYEAFVSCTRTKRPGYSGVATFCRVKSAFSSNEVQLPLSAEEGFTGLLDHSENNAVQINMEAFEDIPKKDLLKIDSEGRCIITDHGHFVLFNLYGPRAEESNEERLHFKYTFYKLLEKRWEFLLSQGKRVFVVGDLNIAPAAIDRCDADPDFEKNKFRKWLRSILRECRGPFFDVFRSKHPGREAYTCFSPMVGAEVFNYGSRIDHILIAGPCFHENNESHCHNLLDCHVEDCDIMVEFMRGKTGTVPKWKGGRSVKLEGSDHIPVYVIMNEMPDLQMHSTPSLAVRYFPEVRGWQRSIVAFLRKEEKSPSTPRCSISNSTGENIEIENCSEYFISSQDSRESSNHHLSSYEMFGKFVPSNTGELLDRSEVKQLRTMSTDDRAMLSSKDTNSHFCSTNLKKKAKKGSSSQLTLSSFFQKPQFISTAETNNSRTDTLGSQLDDAKPVDMFAYTDITGVKSRDNCNAINCKMDDSSTNEFCDGPFDDSTGFQFKSEKSYAAMLEWQRIQQKMKLSIPLCKGHGEPCIARNVKKEGCNMGRRFYVCARAKGPLSNPEANCDHFQWAAVKSRRKTS